MADSAVLKNATELTTSENREMGSVHFPIYTSDKVTVEVDRASAIEHSLDLTHTDTSLQFYLDKCRLPKSYGIPARVMSVMESRIGKSSLSISAVAEELNITKRTLQRRLNQKQLCFVELRDQVRFHYAVGFLLKSKSTIDCISTMLDFSDRTSFTNAFKRWSGLSPSVFRRRYSDFS